MAFLRRKKNLLVNNPPPVNPLVDPASLAASPDGVFNRRAPKPVIAPLPSGAAPAAAVVADTQRRKLRKQRQNRSFQNPDDERDNRRR